MDQHLVGQHSWSSIEGLPYPLGVSWSGEDRTYNFALYSKHATSVRLLLFSADNLASPYEEVSFDPLVNKSGRVWHCRLPESVIDACTYYGYLVDGPQNLQREWFEGRRAVGVTAGASAPELLVQQVVEQLKAWGGREPRQLIGREENVVFSLPKTLRAPATRANRS
jgi:hypothetical protein